MHGPNRGVTGVELNMDWLGGEAPDSKGVDALVFANSYWLGSRTPCLIYGMRGSPAVQQAQRSPKAGIQQITVCVSGPSRDLHSGVHGGCINEPLMDLVHILSTLSDPSGKVGSSNLTAPS